MTANRFEEERFAALNKMTILRLLVQALWTCSNVLLMTKVLAQKSCESESPAMEMAGHVMGGDTRRVWLGDLEWIQWDSTRFLRTDSGIVIATGVDSEVEPAIEAGMKVVHADGTVPEIVEFGAEAKRLGREQGEWEQIKIGDVEHGANSAVACLEAECFENKEDLVNSHVAHFDTGEPAKAKANVAGDEESVDNGRLKVAAFDSVSKRELDVADSGLFDVGEDKRDHWENKRSLKEGEPTGAQL